MNTYRVTLYTVLDFSVAVEAEDEEDAIEQAYKLAPSQPDENLPDGAYLALNEAWQLHDPDVESSDA